MIIREVENDGVSVVIIENPPVNALSLHVREPLFEALAALRDDPATRAIVIACAGRTFVAGADITEFGKPMQQPELQAIVASSKVARRRLWNVRLPYDAGDRLATP